MRSACLRLKEALRSRWVGARRQLASACRAIRAWLRSMWTNDRARTWFAQLFLQVAVTTWWYVLDWFPRGR